MKPLRYEHILKCKDKNQIKKIYFDSFPKKERMPWGLMLLLSCFPTTRFYAYSDDDKPCGFLYYGILGRYIFVMFFAVDKELRCSGYGSRILVELIAKYPKHKIFVTIEPPSEDPTDIRFRRKQFYLRNSFEDTGYVIKSFGDTQEILISGGKFRKNIFALFLLAYSCLAIIPRIKKK